MAEFDDLLSADTTNRDVALSLAKRGFPIFPVRDWEGSGQLKPVKDWPNVATAEFSRVASWWATWPDACIGLLTGARSGIAVLDLDVKDGKDGTAALAEMGLSNLAELSPVRYRTPSGGWHLYFANDERLRTIAQANGVDIRAEGGFAFAPGSLRNGQRYTPEGAPLGAVELPAWPEVLLQGSTATTQAVVVPPLEIEPAELAAILAEIPVDIIEDRESWVRLGAALNHHFGGADEGFRLWMDVSSRGEKYLKRSSERAERRRYDGFGRGRGAPVTMRSVMQWAPIAAEAWRDRLDADEAEQWRESLEELGPKPALSESLFGDEPARLRFLSPDECAAAEARQYVVKGRIAAGDVACIYGAPGAGKSLISPHIGYAVAQGREAFGMRTRPGPVLYVAAEDPHGMRGRITALKRRHGDALGFVLVEGVSDLLTKGSADLKALLAAVAARNPSLIFLDTLAMSFPGLEENSADAMGQVVAIARKLAKGGSAVVLIHHDTKAQSPTPRGHSLLNGALDVALQLFPRDVFGVVRGKLSKNRNGACDRDIAFKIDTETLGTDEDGDAITAALVGELDSFGCPRGEKLSASERAALAVLRGLSSPAEEDDWRAACVAGRTVSGSENAESRRKAAGRAIQGLARKGAVSFREGVARLVGIDDGEAVEGNGFD